jgi:hypothetical protein
MVALVKKREPYSGESLESGPNVYKGIFTGKQGVGNFPAGKRKFLLEEESHPIVMK